MRIPVKDPYLAAKVLKGYDIDAAVDESTGYLTVPSDRQQKASVILAFQDLVGQYGHASPKRAKRISGVDNSDLVELKIPVSDPQVAIRRLAVYGIHSKHNVDKAAITVPRRLEQHAALVLTFGGLLPNGREAYGLFNESSLMNADQRTREVYVSHLQDLLAETIEQSPNISVCEVNLTDGGKPWDIQPSGGKFLARAIVKVNTSHGGFMTEEEQFAIASLVAGSFTFLTESNVRISDFALNYYPTIDESWQMNFTLQSRQRQLQRDAERKIELQLAAYNAKAEVTIPMKVVKVESTGKQGKTQYGTPGEVADAGRDAVHDPRRNIEDTTGSKSAHNDIFQPDYANASAAITLIHPTELSADKIAEAKQIASAATGIPVDRIAINVEKPSPSSANR